jgi:hypothetical protein
MDASQCTHDVAYAEWISRGVLAYSAVRRFKFHNFGTIVRLANQIRRDEPWGAVHLGYLVRQHVTVVVVRRHPKASIGPPNDLHCCGVRNQVLELVIRTHHLGLDVFGLVVRVEPIHTPKLAKARERE